MAWRGLAATGLLAGALAAACRGNDTPLREGDAGEAGHVNAAGHGIGQGGADLDDGGKAFGGEPTGSSAGRGQAGGGAGGAATGEGGSASGAAGDGGQAGSGGPRELDPPVCTGPITFDYEQVEAYAAAALGLESGPITGEQAAQLTQLRIEIHSDAASLECFNNLEVLDLTESTFEVGGAALLSLQHLRSLDLSGALIAPELLAQLTQLESLDVSAYYNFSPSSVPTSLTNLRSLDISDGGYSSGELSDMLPSFPLLERLDARNSELDDFAPFTQLPNLGVLDVGQSGLDSITLSAPLPALEELDVSHNPLTQLTFTAQLPNLRRLNLAGTSIDNADVLALASLPDLVELDVSYTGVTDLAPFASFPSLKLLRAIGPQLSCTGQGGQRAALVEAGVRVLSDCGGGGIAGPMGELRPPTHYDCDLSLAFKHSHALAAVRQMVGTPGRPLTRADVADLSELVIDGTVDGLEGIECLPALRSLTVGGLTNYSEVHSQFPPLRYRALQPLTALTSLETLDLFWDLDYGNPAPDWHWPLAMVPLERLRLAWTNREAEQRPGDGEEYLDTGVIASLTQLEVFELEPDDLVFPPPLPASLLHLDLSGIGYRSPMVAAADSPNLRTLNLEGNPLENLDALVSFEHLEWVDVSDPYGTYQEDVCASDAASVAALRAQGVVVIGCP